VVNGLFALAKNMFFSRTPFFLVLFVTSRCNARCKMCFNWRKNDEWKTREEMTLDEIEQISLNISGLQQLTISGGEPFLRRDLADICYFFSKNSRVQWITIATNGLLSDSIEEVLVKALRQNPEVHFKIGLSMPAIYERLDEIYGVPNSFEKHQETFERLGTLSKRFSNLNVDVGIVFNKFNQKSIKKCFNYVIDHMPGCNLLPLVVRGNPRELEALEIDLKILEDVYQFSKNNTPKVPNRPWSIFINVMRDAVHEVNMNVLQKNKRTIPCQCIRKLVVIYDNGDVAPCELMDSKLGNLRDYGYDIRRILELPKTKRLAKFIKNQCFCTWECANYNNIVFSNKYRFLVLWRAILYMLGRDPSQKGIVHVVKNTFD